MARSHGSRLVKKILGTGARAAVLIPPLTRIHEPSNPGVSGVSEVLILPLTRRNEGSLFIHMGVSWPGENPQNPETPEGTTTHIPPRCNRRSSASSCVRAVPGAPHTCVLGSSASRGVNL